MARSPDARIPLVPGLNIDGMITASRKHLDSGAASGVPWSPSCQHLYQHWSPDADRDPIVRRRAPDTEIAGCFMKVYNLISNMRNCSKRSLNLQLSEGSLNGRSLSRAMMIA